MIENPAYQKQADGEFNQRYAINQALYLGNHQAVFFPTSKPRYPYFVNNWLGDVLVPMWPRLLFGTFPEIVAPLDSEEDLKQAISDLVRDLDLASLLVNASTQATWAGEAVIKVTFSTAHQRALPVLLDSRHVTWEFPNDDPTRPTGASFWIAKDKLVGGKKIPYLLRERQYLSEITRPTLEGGTAAGRIPQEARLQSRQLNMEIIAYNEVGEVVPLAEAFSEEEIAQGLLPKEQEILPIDCLTLVYIPNRQASCGWRGETDFTESRIHIQKAINERFSLDQHILNLHSKPTLIVPDDLIHDGQVNVKDLEWVADEGNGRMKPQYIEWSGELGASERMKEWLSKEFMRVCGFSFALFGEGSAVSGKARELELLSTVAEVLARRHFWEDAIQRIIYLAMAFEQLNSVSSLDPVRDSRVEWNRVLPPDLLEEAQRANLLVSGGLMSVDTGIKLTQDLLTEDEVAEERTRIDEDAQGASAFATGAERLLNLPMNDPGSVSQAG